MPSTETPDLAAFAAAEPISLEAITCPYNRQLVENVRPPEWQNPRARGSYQLVVIGGGTAGLVSAAIAAALGARVALVERKLLGGDCLNFGCVPSKALIRAARAWSAADEAAELFGGRPTSGAGNFARAMERMRRLRAGLSGHDSAARFAGMGVDVFLGKGVFTGARTLAVAGQELRFRRAVIATGSRATEPPIAGLQEAGYLTNETIFSLTELPRRLAVIGGGPIGAELAQAFARFGSRVALFEATDRILPRDDPDAARLIASSLTRCGVELRCAANVARIEHAADERAVHFAGNGEAGEFRADTVLVAAGRTPNVDGLGLEEAGVEYDRRSGIRTDERLRTTNRRVYAIGDVTSAFQFTHVADAQARMVVRNALFFGRAKATDLVIPWCTYTSPELAHVGVTAVEAAARGDAVDTITVPLAEVDRARLDGQTEGFLRLHLRAGSDRILGATLVAEHAGEIISQLTQAMTAGIGLSKIGETIFPYPTQAEVIRKAADQWRRRRLTPRAKRVFGLYFRAFR